MSDAATRGLHRVPATHRQHRRLVVEGLNQRRQRRLLIRTALAFCLCFSPIPPCPTMGARVSNTSSALSVCGVRLLATTGTSRRCTDAPGRARRVRDLVPTAGLCSSCPLSWSVTVHRCGPVVRVRPPCVTPLSPDPPVTHAFSHWPHARHCCFSPPRRSHGAFVGSLCPTTRRHDRNTAAASTTADFASDCRCIVALPTTLATAAGCSGSAKHARPPANGRFPPSAHLGPQRSWRPTGCTGSAPRLPARRCFLDACTILAPYSWR